MTTSVSEITNADENGFVRFILFNTMSFQTLAVLTTSDTHVREGLKIQSIGYYLTKRGAQSSLGIGQKFLHTK